MKEFGRTILFLNDLRLMDDTNSAPTKKGRAPTRLPALTTPRLNGQKVAIEFDSSWDAIGREARRFNSYVGLQGRSKVLILIEDWDHVPQDTKNYIWECIMLTYDVPNNAIL
ncbi:hypothetical protein RIF29_20731 [Crotalaria pallida]|uniref:Uncharacterized protein n=1 Tax=Crotalaria pallida TaxID=3830 RepID=A0AAN9F214_CROPI